MQWNWVLFEHMSARFLHPMGYLLLCSIMAQTACAVHRKGLIQKGGETIYLVESSDRRTPLRGPALNRGLSSIDGFLVEVWGKRNPSSLQVERYRIIDGVHGLANWTGVMDHQYGLLGLVDVEGSQFRPIGGPEKSALERHIGSLVFVEGYIVGAGEVQVVYYRILAESED